MAEHPILFSGPMVRAILEGRKSQTRRIIKPEPMVLADGKPLIDRPLHQVGDTLWVREAFRAEQLSLPPYTRKATAKERKMLNRVTVTIQPEDDGLCGFRYLADDTFVQLSDCEEEAHKWDSAFRYGGSWPTKNLGRIIPPIHMPRWASRITLRVIGVKVERLQDISEADVIAEGLTMTAKAAFEALWTSINGQASWDANPWVVAYSFERVKP